MVSTRAFYENYLRAKYRIPNELSVDGVANKILELFHEKGKKSHLRGDEKVWASRFGIVLLLSITCLYILQPVSTKPKCHHQTWSPPHVQHPTADVNEVKTSW